MKKSRVLIVVGLITIFVSCKQKLTCSDLSKNYFSRLTDFHSKEDSARFIKNLDQLLIKTPNCIKALQMRGNFQMAGEKYQFAKKDFLKAMKIDSSSIYTLFHLSVLYNFENRNNIALALISRAIRLKNSDGYVLELNNNFFGELDVKYQELIHFRGIILYEEGSLSEAKNDFINCINNNYQFEDTYGYLASIYLAEGKVDSACFFHKESILYNYNSILDTSLITKCK